MSNMWQATIILASANRLPSRAYLKLKKYWTGDFPILWYIYESPGMIELPRGVAKYTQMLIHMCGEAKEWLNDVCGLFCFVVVRRWSHLSVSFRIASLALRQSYHCADRPKKNGCIYSTPQDICTRFFVLCFVVVMQSFIMNSHEVFIYIHQGCFAGTGAIVRLPECQWSKPDGYGIISQCITTTKHSKAKIVCIFLWIYCITWNHCESCYNYSKTKPPTYLYWVLHCWLIRRYTSHCKTCT